MADTRITDAEIAGYMGWRGPGAYTEASLRKIRQIVDHVLRAERATPPSPSTAPEVDELNCGMHGSIFVKVWGDAGGGDAGREALAKYVFELGRRAALASRPAEVDDEGLPPLPEPFENWDPRYEGLVLPVFTAEQYRQGQRDAVAADRARRGVVEEPFYPQLFLNWNRNQESPPVAIGKEMHVARKAVELSKAAPSHTTNKDAG